MRFHAGVLALVAAAHTATATVLHPYPLLAFSSKPLPVLDTLEGGIRDNEHANALSNLLYQDSLCSVDAVLFISAPGLCPSHLRSSEILKHFRGAASSVHLPYLKHDLDGTDPLGMAEGLADRCGATFVQIPNEEEGGVALDMKKKHVLCMDGTKNGSLESISNQISAYASTFPSYLVIISALPYHPAIPSKFRQRQLATPPSVAWSPEDLEEDDPSIPKPDPTPLPAQNYRLLSPGLILSLLIVFGTVFPLALIVISAIAGIKSPIQGARFKAPSVEKKNA